MAEATVGIWKTAGFLSQQVRKAMLQGGEPFAGPVEVDETSGSATVATMPGFPQRTSTPLRLRPAASRSPTR